MTPDSGPECGAAAWRKSSRSNQAGGDCVEVADGLLDVLPVRDSKRPHGPALMFGAAAWSAFVDEMKAHRPA
ncbi:DUF397 domain-containing protein [Streptomyces sp. NRRL WC-3549]|uniref:DUF397 domain-containing protein n=1 Tax=Streptomyces sp. NRRL WC-3549 TaxID=1463925 RepID=UPI0004C7429D|nr:DUF397 domain-containing protein [Streptomyces sp. NRRL WC-3549]